MYKIIMNNLFVYFLMAWSLFKVDGFFVRQNDVYNGLIKDVYDHSESRSLVLLYAIRNKHRFQDIETTTRLVKLQRYFDNYFIPTTITDIKRFASQPIGNLSDMSNVLLIFLHDSDDVMEEFMTLLAPLVHLSRQTWLVFLGDQTKIEIFFEDIYIPADCDFMVSQKNLHNEPEEIITEIYRLEEGGKLISNVLTKWSPDIKFKLREIPLSQSRNWQGRELRISILDIPADSIVVRNTDHNPIAQTGITGDILSVIFEKLNFTKHYIDVNEYGRQVNGSWTGGIGDVFSKNSHLFACLVWLTPQGLQMFDYSFAFQSFTYRMYIKKNFSVTKWDKFLDPLDKDIWIILGILILVFSSIISAIVFIRKIMLRRRIGANDYRSTFMNNVFIVFGMLCNQTEDVPESTSTATRTVYLTIFFTLIVVFAAYSAMLTSFLAVNIFHAPFSTMEEFIKDGSYKLSLISTHEDDVLFEPEDENLRKMYDKIVSKAKESNHPSYIEGLTHLCENDKYAFISLDYRAEFRQYDCVLYPTKIKATVPIAIIYQQNSPFKESINIQILLLLECGVVKRVLSHYRRKLENMEQPFVAPVELIDAMPMIIFLLAIIFLSLLILCGEIVVHRIIMERKLKKQILKRIPKRMLVAQTKLHSNKYQNIDVGTWMLYRQNIKQKRLANRMHR